MRNVHQVEGDAATPSRISILFNDNVEHASSLAAEMSAWLGKRDLEVEVCPRDSLVSNTGWICDSQLLVTLGGDGTILRAVRAAAPCGVVLLGVNLGRVGFLTEAEPSNWREVVGRVLSGDYWVEERMMLRVISARSGRPMSEADALNDVFVGRGDRAQVVHLRTEVDGGEMGTYVADGLIVATPTGSTAYALAAGGPILPPELRNIVLVPVAPHLTIDRPVVLSEGATVRVCVTGDRRAVLTVDGRLEAELNDGDVVEVEASRHIARFARVRERTYFYRTLVDRLVPRNHT